MRAKIWSWDKTTRNEKSKWGKAEEERGIAAERKNFLFTLMIFSCVNELSPSSLHRRLSMSCVRLWSHKNLQLWW